MQQGLKSLILTTVPDPPSCLYEFSSPAECWVGRTNSIEEDLFRSLDLETQSVTMGRCGRAKKLAFGDQEAENACIYSSFYSDAF